MSDQPTFDFSNFSYKQSRALGRLTLRLQRLTSQLADSSGMDDDEFDAKLDEMDKLSDEALGYVARLVVDVPRSWLVDGAPKTLDWSNVSALEWLRNDKMQELQDAALAARSPESVSGN